MSNYVSAKFLDKEYRQPKSGTEFAVYPKAYTFENPCGLEVREGNLVVVSTRSGQAVCTVAEVGVEPPVLPEGVVFQAVLAVIDVEMHTVQGCEVFSVAEAVEDLGKVLPWLAEEISEELKL